MCARHVGEVDAVFARGLRPGPRAGNGAAVGDVEDGCAALRDGVEFRPGGLGVVLALGIGGERLPSGEPVESGCTPVR